MKSFKIRVSHIRTSILAVLLFLVSLFFSPAPTLAQVDAQAGEGNAGDFIPCSGTECSACDLVALANNVIDWLIGFLAVVFAIIFVWAGIRLVISGGNPGAKEAAKSALTNAVIGFIIVLGAWLLIDTLMRALIGQDGQINGSMPWSQIECAKQVVPGTIPYTVPVLDNAEAVSGTAQYSTGGTGVTPTGKLVEYQGRKFDEAVVDKARYLDENFDLRISGGYRTPERNAEVNGSPTSYHLSGRAIDLVGTRSAMEAGAQWARQNGAKEVLIHNAGSGTHLHVAW